MLEHYRKMSPRERIAEMSALNKVAWCALMSLPPEERERRLEAETRIRRESIKALLAGLAAADEQTRQHGG